MTDLIKKRLFYIFLVVHALLWSLIQLLRGIISIDSMEAISWGELISFGTNKHPPLSGWLMAGAWHLTGIDYVVYLLGQICIIVGFIYVYKLAKYFLSEEKAFCSAMILEGCFYYSYYIFVNSYNCNVLLMGLWPVITYYFYKSLKENATKDWVIFGIVAGLGFLGKYQIVFLFMGFLVYLLAFAREQFKNKNMYLSILVGSLVILPHVVWLIQTDFFSFSYMLERTGSETHNLPLILVKMSHIFYPIKFMVGQLIAVASCLGMYLILALQAKNIGFKNPDANKKDIGFLSIVSLVPIIAQGSMAFFTGSRVPSIWGSIMVSMFGILFFYFLPIKFKENSYLFFVKLSYFAMFVSLLVVLIFDLLQTQLVISFPHNKITTDFDKIWQVETNDAPLKYVGGEMGYCFAFRHYDKEHPEVVLETFGHKNPWVDHDDVLKSGMLILAEEKDEVVRLTKDLVYLLPEDYKIVPKQYSLELCNILKKCYTEEFYYVIVSPLR